MTAHAPAHAEGHHGHAPRNYVKIWGILVVLLVVSVFGPMIGIRWITLIAAFGVALVKAYMVAKNFMHLDIEKPIVHWILLVALALMVLLYGALAPDIQKGTGMGWKKDAGFHPKTAPSHAGEHGTGAAGSTEHGQP
jgi:caa(3)-type oxidase subunit IV